MSKQKVAYYRKLYLAYVIDHDQHDLLSLQTTTGMPRRTLQDAIKAFDTIGVVCEFVQDGPKNHHGYYRISDWGDHRVEWLTENLDRVLQILREGGVEPLAS